MLSKLTRAFPAFSEPAVARYLSGQLASILGNWTQNITLSLVLWEQTHSPALVGLLNFLLQGPMLFVPMLAGPRMHPANVRRNTLCILLCSLTISTILLLGSLSTTLSVWFVLLMAGLLGIVMALEWPARQLLLSSSLRDRSLLTNAVAMNALIFNIGRMSGPALAAAFFARVGAAAGFACSVAGLLVMLTVIRGLPTPVAPDDKPRERASIRAAVRFAASDEFAMRFLPMLVTFGLFVGSYQTIIPALAAREFGSVSRYTGLFFACAGAGSFMASVALASLRDSQRARKALDAAPWVSSFALLGIGLSQHAPLTGLFFFAIGLSIALSTTQINSNLQQRCPAQLRGGIVGLYAVAFLGSMPLGHVLMGAVASWLGPRLAFVVMGVSTLVFLRGLRAWVRRLTRSTDVRS